MKQLLIYASAAPVSRQRHANWSVDVGPDYKFAREVNSVPLMATEFSSAANEYPIVFTGTKGTVLPAVILGVQDQQNAYVDDTGTWNAEYIPAFVRRYPFVFSATENGGRGFTLCIDEEFGGFNQDGRGERLFDDAGERTQYLENVLDFTRQYQVQFERTKAFCDRLESLNLLEPMHAQFATESDGQVSLAGFMAVRRERLKAIGPQELLEIFRTDELELIYIHLLSMRNFAMLGKRVSKAPTAQATRANSTPESSKRQRRGRSRPR